MTIILNIISLDLSMIEKKVQLLNVLIMKIEILLFPLIKMQNSLYKKNIRLQENRKEVEILTIQALFPLTQQNHLDQDMVHFQYLEKKYLKTIGDTTLNTQTQKSYILTFQHIQNGKNKLVTHMRLAQNTYTIRGEIISPYIKLQMKKIKSIVIHS